MDAFILAMEPVWLSIQPRGARPTGLVCGAASLAAVGAAATMDRSALARWAMALAMGCMLMIAGSAVATGPGGATSIGVAVSEALAVHMAAVVFLWPVLMGMGFVADRAPAGVAATPAAAPAAAPAAGARTADASPGRGAPAISAASAVAAMLVITLLLRPKGLTADMATRFLATGSQLAVAITFGGARPGLVVAIELVAAVVRHVASRWAAAPPPNTPAAGGSGGDVGAAAAMPVDVPAVAETNTCPDMCVPPGARGEDACYAHNIEVQRVHLLARRNRAVNLPPTDGMTVAERACLRRHQPGSRCSWCSGGFGCMRTRVVGQQCASSVEQRAVALAQIADESRRLSDEGDGVLTHEQQLARAVAARTVVRTGSDMESLAELHARGR